jgi:hypothetical protein
LRVLRRGSAGTWVTGGSGVSDNAADTAIWYTGGCAEPFPWLLRWERSKGGEIKGAWLYYGGLQRRCTSAPGDYPKKVSDPEPSADGEEMGAWQWHAADEGWETMLGL